MKFPPTFGELNETPMRKTFSLLFAAALLLQFPLFSLAQNAIDKTSDGVDKASNTINKVGSFFKKKNKNKPDTATTKPAAAPDGNTNITINSVYDFTPGN